MFRIWKHFRFSASHVLTGLPEGHQCGRLHGHNYTVELELTSPGVDVTGFVRDFGELKPFKVYIDEYLDHQHLNAVFDFNPTAENMAKCLYEKFSVMWPEITAIRVQETESSWAEYRP